jgi:hypothetical protein
MQSILKNTDPEWLLIVGTALVAVGVLGLAVWFLLSMVVAVRREVRRRHRRHRL